MEKNKDIEKAAAMALLDRGVGFTIPAPFLFRMFGKKKMKIAVRRLRLGTLVHLSTISDFELVPTPHAASGEHREIIKEMGGEPKSLSIKTIVENRKPVSLAIASCLLNSQLKIALWSHLLAGHLRRCCNNDQLQELIMWLFIYGRAESFTNITRFLGRMTMTMPMNLGQQEKGS